jgi:hypothetical protein
MASIVPAQFFSGLGCVAAIDPTGNRDLSPHQRISEGRNVWLDQPDSTLGSISAKQHRRRAGKTDSGEFRQFLGVARGSIFELQT